VSKELLETGMLSVFVFVRWSKEAIRRHWPALGKGILIKSGTGVRRWCILWGSGRPKMEIPVNNLYPEKRRRTWVFWVSSSLRRDLWWGIAQVLANYTGNSTSISSTAGVGV